MFRSLSVAGVASCMKYCAKWMNIKTILHYFIPDQRNLGMSMKIERSSVDQVKARFSLKKKKLEEKRKDYDLEQRVA